MLSVVMIDRLNRQIQLEQFSSNLYLQMSAWCDHQGYTGSAAFLREHAGEELVHMHKLFDYVCETGALAQIGALEAPQSDFKSLGEVFEVTYKHELTITAAINQLVASALAEQDFSTSSSCSVCQRATRRRAPVQEHSRQDCRDRPRRQRDLLPG